MKKIYLLSLVALTSFACTKAPQTPVEISTQETAMFASLPKDFPNPDNAYNDAKIKLGRMLYFDKRLSKNQDISCNSCHNLAAFGVDGQATSPGHKGARGDRNSPTSFNAAGHIAQFWDGRAPTVEEQAKGPILNPIEMAMPNETAVLNVLNSIPEYVSLFKEAFPESNNPVSYNNLGLAIGAFERKLVSPSRFDEFLGGNKDALTAAEKLGFKKFTEVGCAACHNGALIGGSMYQKAGLVKPWPNQKDLGRFNVTKNEAEKLFFKVPSLRNIEKTAPYFHDGSVADLNQAVQMMAEHQLGKTLSQQDIAAIVAWLKSLTGKIDAEYTIEPTLPASTDSTPKAAL